MSNNKMNHKNAKQPLRLFWDLLMLQKGKVFLTIFACIFGSMLYTAIPWFMGIAIDNMVAILKEFALPNINKDMVIAAIGTPVLIIIAASALSFLFSYIAERFMADVSEETSLYLRKEISKKLTNLPLRFYDRTKIGSLLSICSTDIDKISEILVIGFNQFMLAFFDLIFGIAIMLWISPKLTGIVLVVVAFSMFTTLFISRKSQAAFRKNLATLGNFNATVEELYSGSLLIKAFNTQDASIEKNERGQRKAIPCAFESAIYELCHLSSGAFYQPIGIHSKCYSRSDIGYPRNDYPWGCSSVLAVCKPGV